MKKRLKSKIIYNEIMKDKEKQKSRKKRKKTKKIQKIIEKNEICLYKFQL